MDPDVSRAETPICLDMNHMILVKQNFLISGYAGPLRWKWIENALDRDNSTYAFFTFLR